MGQSLSVDMERIQLIIDLSTTRRMCLLGVWSQEGDALACTHCVPRSLVLSFFGEALEQRFIAEVLVGEEGLQSWRQRLEAQRQSKVAESFNRAKKRSWQSMSGNSFTQERERDYRQGGCGDDGRWTKPVRPLLPGLGDGFQVQIRAVLVRLASDASPGYSGHPFTSVHGLRGA
eukprot:scaffold938_cov334-Pavlova_lutheri.AAC.56